MKKTWIFLTLLILSVAVLFYVTSRQQQYVKIHKEQFYFDETNINGFAIVTQNSNPAILDIKKKRLITDSRLFPVASDITGIVELKEVNNGFHIKSESSEFTVQFPQNTPPFKVLAISFKRRAVLCIAKKNRLDDWKTWQNSLFVIKEDDDKLYLPLSNSNITFFPFGGYYLRRVRVNKAGDFIILLTWTDRNYNESDGSHIALISNEEKKIDVVVYTNNFFIYDISVDGNYAIKENKNEIIICNIENTKNTWIINKNDISISRVHSWDYAFGSSPTEILVSSRKPTNAVLVTHSNDKQKFVKFKQVDIVIAVGYGYFNSWTESDTIGIIWNHGIHSTITNLD